MRVKLYLLLFLIFFWSTGFSQSKMETFTIAMPEMKVPNSLYNSIHLLDIRKDTTDFGIVQKGGFNRIEKVITETPLFIQFTKLLTGMVDSSAKNGELLLLLRQLSFAEVTGSMSERGYFQFRATLFSHSNGKYGIVATIDTVVVVKSMDVTKKMLRLGNSTITDFLATNLTKETPSDNLLVVEQLLKIDSIEKSVLPLYATTTYTDGIYYNFNSFVMQQPDETGLSVSYYKNGKVKTIIYTDKKNRQQEMDYRYIYAFTDKGKIYISGEFACYPLEKREDDFYFIGEARNSKSKDVATATIFYGVIGGLIASSASSLFEMKIDHLSGGFIRIKEVKK